uniref:AlNc14C118G6574 protein n=1 Tax=Albugo laibachii Nc14 TaxID=890382 RepID=F0WJ43_9STRA|nr:AlNc14C118G6574 [Albugo laibachii Nc14]|eukprot:CCA21289.1 AlNc14C118G6574 [Albugo laibachii Nc14]
MKIQLLKAYILAIIGAFPVHYSSVDAEHIKLVPRPSAMAAERIQIGLHVTLSKSKEKGQEYELIFSIDSSEAESQLATKHYATLPNCGHTPLASIEGYSNVHDIRTNPLVRTKSRVKKWRQRKKLKGSYLDPQTFLRTQHGIYLLDWPENHDDPMHFLDTKVPCLDKVKFVNGSQLMKALVVNEDTLIEPLSVKIFSKV